MTKLTIIAHITAHEGKVELLKSELEKLLVPTRNEPGCLQYDLHQDNKNAAHFMFCESWESREAWQTHMVAPPLQDYLKAVEGAVSDFTLYEMTHIG